LSCSAEEKALYGAVTRYVKKEFKEQFHTATGKTVHMLSLVTPQREVMSSPAAVEATLLKIARRKGYPAESLRSLEAYAAMAAGIRQPSKMAALREIVGRFPGWRFVVFTEFVKSMEFIARNLQESGSAVLTVSGRLDAGAKAAVLARFRETPGSVLVST
jgi:superfamily II DNA/RNA helicase